MPAPIELERLRERLMVLGAQQGNREAFSRLIDLYDRRLLYFVRRILGENDAALDVVQSVWLHAHRKPGKLKSPDAFRVWLYRITHDQAVTELRRKSTRAVFSDDADTSQVEDDTNVDSSAFDKAELVHVALRDLSSESQYKEYRMKLEDVLTAAERRERLVGHAAWVSFLIAGVLMFVGGSRVAGSFDPWSHDATILSVTLGAIYCIATLTWPLATASYFSRFRPRVRDIKEQIRDTTILALQCEIAELRTLIGATRRDDTT